MYAVIDNGIEKHIYAVMDSGALGCMYEESNLDKIILNASNLDNIIINESRSLNLCCFIKYKKIKPTM